MTKSVYRTFLMISNMLIKHLARRNWVPFFSVSRTLPLYHSYHLTRQPTLTVDCCPFQGLKDDYLYMRKNNNNNPAEFYTPLTEFKFYRGTTRTKPKTTVTIVCCPIILLFVNLFLVDWVSIGWILPIPSYSVKEKNDGFQSVLRRVH